MSTCYYGYAELEDTPAADRLLDEGRGESMLVKKDGLIVLVFEYGKVPEWLRSPSGHPEAVRDVALYCEHSGDKDGWKDDAKFLEWLQLAEELRMQREDEYEKEQAAKKALQLSALKAKLLAGGATVASLEARRNALKAQLEKEQAFQAGNLKLRDDLDKLIDQAADQISRSKSEIDMIGNQIDLLA